MTTNTHELIEALEKADERASVKIMVKDYADGWYELKVSRRPNVEQLRQALAIQPQAEAQPGVGELRDQLFAKAAENTAADRFNSSLDLLTPDDALEILTPAQPAAVSGWRDTVKAVAESANVNSYEMDEDDIATLLTGIRLDLNHLLYQDEKAPLPPQNQGG
tara:strand:- start:19034 stop:19522 length:489 start_codon:yes stop_codon:yes gene_type:complete